MTSAECILSTLRIGAHSSWQMRLSLPHDSEGWSTFLGWLGWLQILLGWLLRGSGQQRLGCRLARLGISRKLKMKFVHNQKLTVKAKVLGKRLGAQELETALNKVAYRPSIFVQISRSKALICWIKKWKQFAFLLRNKSN